MANFKIPKVSSTTNKTIRFPNDIIEEIEGAIAGTGCTFSAFVIAAAKNALDELADSRGEEQKREEYLVK